MVIEQEPIKIEIPVEEDEVVMVPERSSPDAAQRVSAGAQHMAMRARDTWQSEKRRQTQALVPSAEVVNAACPGRKRIAGWPGARAKLAQRSACTARRAFYAG